MADETGDRPLSKTQWRLVADLQPLCMSYCRQIAKRRNCDEERLCDSVQDALIAYVKGKSDDELRAEMELYATEMGTPAGSNGLMQHVRRNVDNDLRTESRRRNKQSGLDDIDMEEEAERRSPTNVASLEEIVDTICNSDLKAEDIEIALKVIDAQAFGRSLASELTSAERKRWYNTVRIQTRRLLADIDGLRWCDDE